jgi:hypothetical protein
MNFEGYLLLRICDKNSSKDSKGFLYIILLYLGTIPDHAARIIFANMVVCTSAERKEEIN